MDLFTKNRLSLWIIIILIVLNIFTLGTLWLQRLKPFPPPPFVLKEIPGDIPFFLKRELKLTEQQIQQFIKYRDKHFRQSSAIREEIHQLRKLIMDELFAPEPDTMKVEILAGEVGAKQVEFERLLFYHFQELKLVCRPEQQRKFRMIFRDLIKVIKPPGAREPRKGAPPRRFRGPD